MLAPEFLVKKENSCWLEVADWLKNQPNTIIDHTYAIVNDFGVAVSLVAMNWKGELVGVASKLILTCSPIAMKLKALDWAMDMAMSAG